MSESARQGRTLPKKTAASPAERISATAAMLAKQFGGKVVVTLEEVCPLLGLDLEKARVEYNRGELPFAAFRMRDSAKAPLLVHVRELAAHIDAQSLRAQDQVRRARV